MIPTRTILKGNEPVLVYPIQMKSTSNLVTHYYVHIIYTKLNDNEHRLRTINIPTRNQRDEIFATETELEEGYNKLICDLEKQGFTVIKKEEC